MGPIHQEFSDFQHEHRYFLWFYENMKTLQIISFLLKLIFPPQYESNPENLMGYQTMANSPDKYITAKNFFLKITFQIL